MAVPSSPRGHMPDDGYNSGIGRGSDCCIRCNHPMGFHSASQNDMTVTCHLGGCTCNVTYEEAMDRAAEIRGDTEQLKYNRQRQIRKLEEEIEKPIRDNTRFRALQRELAEQRARYEVLLQQATRAEVMRVRPIIVSTDRTILDGVVFPSPGDNENVEIRHLDPVIEPKKHRVKPEPSPRRVVKLPKRGA